MKCQLIAVDIGNSSITIGYFTETGLIVQNIATTPLQKINKYLSVLSNFMSQNGIEKSPFNVIISSVVGSHTARLKSVFRELAGGQKTDILLVQHKMNTGLRFKIPSPERLGADRIANVAGAYEIYKTNVAVVDFGTATTISCADKKGNYIGGSIMPGIRLMNELLDRGTAQLKKAALHLPQSALGTGTDECICSGVFYGTAGAVERILGEIERETKVRFRVILTGGHAAAMDRFIQKRHVLDPNLTLKGLKTLYEKNRPA